MSTNCSGYVITNGCGHCFESSPEDERSKSVSVCMGTDFCNRGCRAMCMGWKCCTYGFKVVDGLNQPRSGISAAK
jgi:hypothetical protein